MNTHFAHAHIVQAQQFTEEQAYGTLFPAT